MIVWGGIVAFLFWIADRVGFLKPVVDRILK
jgi:mannitol-1-phosphate/altronate dehydrogenase